MAKFQLGVVVMTPTVAKLLTSEEVESLVARHAGGDWGEVPDEDWQENDLSLMHGWRILSSYPVRGQKIWVITEADREATTLLLPSEY
jgi:hypothetical protein